MADKICYYCGTKYPEAEKQCPLCGQTETEPDALDEVPVEHLPPREAEQPAQPIAHKKHSGLVSTLVCIFLSLAIIAGGVYILNFLGFFSFEQQPSEEGSLSLPVEDVQPAEILCTGIQLAPERATFDKVGDTIALYVTVSPFGCTQQVEYLSSDDSVATVSDTGTVTAVARGTAEITATCGEFAASMEVTCNIPQTPDPSENDPNGQQEPGGGTDAEELSLSVDDFTLFEAGETARIQVIGLPADAEVLWSSSDETVAVVKDGKVTGVGGGTATVAAEVNGEKLKCVVRCKFTGSVAPQEIPMEGGSIALSHEDVTLAVGETFRIRLLDGETRLSGVIWTSNTLSVCSVDADGNVLCTGSGVGKVVGTYNGVNYTCIIRGK